MRMLIAKVIDLAKEINGRTLFRNVSFDIAEGERIALYGRNGTGKTTLLRGLLGHVAFDRGRVERRLPLESWGWMAQQADADRSMTTLDYVLSAKPELYALKKTHGGAAADHGFAAARSRVPAAANGGNGRTSRHTSRGTPRRGNGETAPCGRRAAVR